MSGCLGWQLYGDGAFSKNGGDMLSGGWPRRYLVSTDVSSDHSGGPMYVVFGSGASDSVVFGVVNTQLCAGAACTSNLNNPLVTVGRALTENYFNSILNFMSQY